MPQYRYDIPALLDHLESVGEIDGFLTDMFHLKNLTDSDFRAADALFDPLVSAEQKQACFDLLFEPEKRKAFYQFFSRLVRNGDVGVYWRLRRRLVRHLEKTRNYAFANVVSAVPLEEKELDDVKRNLERITGKTVYTYNSISTRLLGGFVIKIDDKMIDLSVLGNFLKMKPEFSKRE